MKKLLLYFSFVVIIFIFGFWLFAFGGWVFIFSDKIVEILSLIASIIALIVAIIALLLQMKTDKDVKQMEDNIDKVENNIKKISKITSEMQSNINKTYFQIERTTAINKYPEREEFKKINEGYLNFIFPLFDEEYTNIEITVKTNFNLGYKIKFIKNDISIPLKKEISGFYFYIIKIVSPADSEFLEEKQLKRYEQSPIKDGEYYACRFDEGKCSWFLGEPLSLGQKYRDCYSFYVSGLSSETAEIVPSANEIMRYNRNTYPADEYKLIDKFIIGIDGGFPANSGSLFRLFQNENEIFFTINNSPLKKIYIIKTWIQVQRKRFLVFENLRGHIKSEKFVENFKNRILEKINWNNLPEKIIT